MRSNHPFLPVLVILAIVAGLYFGGLMVWLRGRLTTSLATSGKVLFCVPDTPANHVLAQLYAPLLRARQCGVCSVLPRSRKV